MRRREVIRLICGAAAVWPLVVRAQQLDRVRRIRVLIAQAESDREARSWIAAFREELRKLGWTEGRNIEIDTRWATGDVESMKRFAKEFVALQPDLIVTISTPATAAMLQQTRTIPIIFVLVADPVGSGFVTNLSRPGGNVSLLSWLRWAGSGWNSSKRLHRASPRSFCCSTHQRQHLSVVI